MVSNTLQSHMDSSKEQLSAPSKSQRLGRTETADQNPSPQETMNQERVLTEPEEDSKQNSDYEDKLIIALKKKQKTEQDIEYITEVIRNFSFFLPFTREYMSLIDDQGLSEMSKQMQFEAVPAATVIMKEGEESNEKFYVILSGECSVVKRKHINLFERQNLEEEMSEGGGAKGRLPSKTRKMELTANSNQHISIGRSEESLSALAKVQKAMNISVFGRYKTPKPENSDLGMRTVDDLISRFGVLTKVLHKGDTFGEAALLQVNSRRNATIISNVDCQLITLSKKDFQMIAQRFQRGNKSKLEFLREAIPEIANISGREVLADYLYSFKNVYFKKGTTVVLAGSPGEELFVLVEGQCEVEMKEADAIRPESVKTITVARLAPGAIIGEELIFESKKEYKYTIRVKSLGAVLYSADAAMVKIRFPREAIAKLRELYRQKKEYRKEQIIVLTDQLKNQELRNGLPKESHAEFEELNKFILPGAKVTFLNKILSKNLEPQEKEKGAFEKYESEKPKEKWSSQYSRNVYNIRDILVKNYRQTLDEYNTVLTGVANEGNRNEGYALEGEVLHKNEDEEAKLYVQGTHAQNMIKNSEHIARSQSQPQLPNTDFFPTQLKFPEHDQFSAKNKHVDFVGQSNEKGRFRVLFTAQKHEMDLHAAAKPTNEKKFASPKNRNSPNNSPNNAHEKFNGGTTSTKINRDDREYIAALNFKKIRGDINNKRNYIIREKGRTRQKSLEQIKRNEIKLDEKLDLVKQFNRMKLEEFEQFNFGTTRNFEKANSSLKKRLVMRIQTAHHLQDKQRFVFLEPSEKNSFNELRKATASLKNEQEIFVDLAQKFAQNHNPSVKQLKNILNLSLKSQTPQVYPKNGSIDADSLSIVNSSTAQSSTIKPRLFIQSQPSSPVSKRGLNIEKASSKPISLSRAISSALTNKRSTATTFRNMSATSSHWDTTTHWNVQEKLLAQKANSLKDFRTYFALTRKKYVPSFNTLQLQFEVTNSKKGF